MSMEVWWRLIYRRIRQLNLLVYELKVQVWVSLI